MTPYSLNILRLSYSYTTQLAQICLRGCHSLWRSFPGPSAECASLKVAPHLPCFAARDSVCPLSLSFALLAKSLSLSSPAGTKIFQFPAYACATIHGAKGNPRFKARHAATLGFSQLATTFIAAGAKPSPRWLNFSQCNQACFYSNPLPVGNFTWFMAQML